MYIDHRSAIAMQDRRLAELRRLADRRRAVEALQIDQEPAAALPRRRPLRTWVARLRPHHA